jgi:hypothetical protein
MRRRKSQTSCLGIERMYRPARKHFRCWRFTCGAAALPVLNGTRPPPVGVMEPGLFGLATSCFPRANPCLRRPASSRPRMSPLNVMFSRICHGEVRLVASGIETASAPVSPGLGVDPGLSHADMCPRLSCVRPYSSQMLSAASMVSGRTPHPYWLYRLGFKFTRLANSVCLTPRAWHV